MTVTQIQSGIFFIPLRQIFYLVFKSFFIGFSALDYVNCNAFVIVQNPMFIFDSVCC